jgi:hypothetical protein
MEYLVTKGDQPTLLWAYRSMFAPVLTLSITVTFFRRGSSITIQQYTS